MVSDVTVPLLACLLVLVALSAATVLLDRGVRRTRRRSVVRARLDLRRRVDLCPRVELVDLADAVT